MNANPAAHSSEPAALAAAAVPAAAAAPVAPAAQRRSWLRPVLLYGGVLVVLAGALWYYLASGRYVSTDDSAVQAAQASVSTNIPGRVVTIQVRDNQRVRAGDVLFRLDDRPYQIALEDARAKLASARMQISAAQATYRRQQAEVAAARDTVTYQQGEFERQQRLVQSGISSRSQFEQTRHALEVAQSQYTGAQQQLGAVLAMLGGRPDLPLEQHPTVMQAQAALDRANLELSYTVIRAPSDGITAKVEQLQVGDYINAAVPVFNLVSDQDIWVEANFKEDDLAYMRAGQSAEVHIDAFPGRAFRGHVTSLSPGTGAQFSVLPPENATGNWVKVVQRVPVRVQFEASDLDAVPLHAGLSASVTVDTRHQRNLFSQTAQVTSPP
jgi:membrane fusion protein (multidrug efflux system)